MLQSRKSVCFHWQTEKDTNAGGDDQKTLQTILNFTIDETVLIYLLPIYCQNILSNYAGV